MPNAAFFVTWSRRCCMHAQLLAEVVEDESKSLPWQPVWCIPAWHMALSAFVKICEYVKKDDIMIYYDIGFYDFLWLSCCLLPASSNKTENVPTPGAVHMAVAGVAGVGNGFGHGGPWDSGHQRGRSQWPILVLHNAIAAKFFRNRKTLYIKRYMCVCCIWLYVYIYMNRYIYIYIYIYQNRSLD